MRSPAFGASRLCVSRGSLPPCPTLPRRPSPPRHPKNWGLGQSRQPQGRAGRREATRGGAGRRGAHGVAAEGCAVRGEGSVGSGPPHGRLGWGRLVPRPGPLLPSCPAGGVRQRLRRQALACFGPWGPGACLPLVCQSVGAARHGAPARTLRPTIKAERHTSMTLGLEMHTVPERHSHGIKARGDHLPRSCTIKFNFIEEILNNLMSF